MILRDFADLSVFLSLNIIGIFFLISVSLFILCLFNKETERKIFSALGMTYKKVNRIVFFAVISVFIISYIILGNGFLRFFENKFLMVFVAVGLLNFVYGGWLKK